MASSMSSFSSLSPHPETSAPEPAAGLPPCQALFHYHTCGCRTTRPVFVCAAPRCAHGGALAALVSAVPFACQSSRRGAWRRSKRGRVGRRAACAAADPAARGFQREEDTAPAVRAGDLVRLAPRAGLDARTLDAVVPPFVEGDRDWRAVVAERYARLRRPACPGPLSVRTADVPGPTAERHADEAPAREEPGFKGVGAPPAPGPRPTSTGPSELAADAPPPYRAPTNDRAFAAYQGAQLGNAESVLVWLTAHHLAPTEPAAVPESPLRSLLRDSEPLPSHAAPSRLDPLTPSGPIRRTPRMPGALVDTSLDRSSGAKHSGSEGLAQPQKSLLGRSITTYFTGGLL